MCRSEDLRTSCKRRGLEGHRGRQEADESGGPSLRTAPSGLDGAKDEKRRAACGAVQHKTSLRRVFPVLRYTLSEAQTPSQRDRYSAPGTLQSQSQLVLLEPASFCLRIYHTAFFALRMRSARVALCSVAARRVVDETSPCGLGWSDAMSSTQTLRAGIHSALWGRAFALCAARDCAMCFRAPASGCRRHFCGLCAACRVGERRMGMCIDRRRRTYGQAGGTRTTSVMYAGGGTLRACALPLGPGRWLWAGSLACGVTLSTCAQATPVMVMPSAGGTRTTSWYQRTPPMHTTPASSTAATYNHGPH
ncbi:hypothetical protein C8J57DRAFT_1235277 [Mycena rebaudengoi]|nr:hypothetical protein C8J57DRAFT_1235277 [Mycena rebaudengoi]